MIIFNAKAQRREDAKGKQKLFLLFAPLCFRVFALNFLVR